jgi:hypothetical protein
LKDAEEQKNGKAVRHYGSENKNAGRIMLQDQKFSPVANLPRQKSRSSIHFRSALLETKGKTVPSFLLQGAAGLLLEQAEKKRNEKIKYKAEGHDLGSFLLRDH